MLNKMKLKRGFTLVELMIVVAIIGVLAALAIYGVSKYLASSKTAEAKQALGRIGKDASAAFQREKMGGTVLDAGNPAAPSNELCPDAGWVPANLSDVAGQKYQTAITDWTGNAGWSCLKFNMESPQYYRYQYDETNNESFVATAQGDLDADNTPSVFSLGGAVRQGVVVLAPAIEEANPEE